MTVGSSYIVLLLFLAVIVVAISIMPSMAAYAYEWVEVNDSMLSPPARRSHAMSFDPERGSIVLFGGYGNGTHLGDTWIFSTDKQKWEKIESAQSPSPRAAATLVFEPLHKRHVLFGGFSLGHSIVSSDTWAFDTFTNQWIDLKADNPPSARASYGMAYDSKRDLVVLFGGFTEGGYFNDIWAYDPQTNSWEELSVSGNDIPSPRGAMGFAYDERNDVFVMFGGFSDSGFYGDTWAFDPETDSWKEMSSENNPPPLRTRMVYDNVTGLFTFFGGDVIYPDTVEAAVQPYGGVWAYDYSENEWRQLSIDDSDFAPAKRSLNGIVFDHLTSSVVIFGGTDSLIDDENFSGHEFGDLWILNPASSKVMTLEHNALGNSEEILSMIVVVVSGIAGAALVSTVFLRRAMRAK